MRPDTLSEQLMFNTVKLTASDGSSGTGFFFNFNVNDKVFPTLITNKHVVNNNPHEVMTFYLHLQNEDGDSTESYAVLYNTEWIFHSTKDLCFCFINPVFDEIKRITGKDVFFRAIDNSFLATSDKLKELSALESLVMVGYPIGLWDEKNNFPIFRTGYTASHPDFDFNESGVGVVDMACFPGSSGSPIFILNEGGYVDRSGNLKWGEDRCILIGVLYAGPTYNALGQLVIENIPTQKITRPFTPVMINLGYYIKAEALKEFEQYIINLH